MAAATLTAIALRPLLFGIEPLCHVDTLVPVTQAALFAYVAGASRALFASIAFGLEITRQFDTLLPLLAGCTMAFIVSALTMRTTIMTEKLARRGHHVQSE